ncbi:GNS1/SUR4 family domain-containing protein [Phthorimaea operculella]|nr:GNS1/SUR4 family domain-containing protein [Phthorimaea operculella]
MATDLNNIPLHPKEDTTSFWDFRGNDPKVDSWPLMGSPVPILLILTSYFLMIAIGPRLMKNRAPFKLDKMLMYYNGIQVIISAVLAYKIVEKGIFKNGFLLGGCHYPMKTKDEEIWIGHYVYFLSKVTELLDTVFFVLRKKNNQITLLHVYHHSTMVLYMWSFFKYSPGGDGAVLAFLNCCVHTVMYTYYFLSGLGPKYQKFLWWKKYVTEMQLIQFILMLTYIVYTQMSPKCNFSTFFNGFIGFNISVYLILFLDFYFRSYRKKSDKIIS